MIWLCMKIITKCNISATCVSTCAILRGDLRVNLRNSAFLLGAVHKRCVHSKGGLCGYLRTRGVVQMRSSTLFGAKNFEFSKFIVCPHGQRGRGRASADIFRTREVNFSRFCVNVFYGHPLIEIYRFWLSRKLADIYCYCIVHLLSLFSFFDCTFSLSRRLASYFLIFKLE